MNLTTVLFDLDGTLLPMEQDDFVKAYFGLLAKKLAPLGYEAPALIDAIWKGTAAMVKNDGKQSNEQTFWDDFCSRFGEEARKDEPVFAEFYANEFQRVQEICGFAPDAAKTVRAIKAMGLRVALATNPIFPAIATQSRIRWAGLQPEEFEYYTTYENSRYCKPNPAYYEDVLKQLGLRADECLMVGNDVIEDGAAMKLGMRVFFLTDCLINKNEQDISNHPHGSFEDLLEYIKTL